MLKVPRKDVRFISPDEYATRRKRREQTGFADDQAARAIPLASADDQRSRKRYSITATKLTMQLARKCGKGNASRGIERALAIWIENRSRQNPSPKMRKRVDIRKLR